MAAGGDQRVHELVAVLVRALDEHPVVVQRIEELQRARRRVEPDGHADLRVLGRKARQQHRDAALPGGRVAQPRAAHRQPATRAQRSGSGT